MRALAVLALVALGSPLPAHADSDVYTPPLVPGTVAVYRGGNASVSSTVPVHRGSAIRPRHLSSRAPAGAVATVGGRRIWFVDQTEDRLTSCRVINTFNVGDRRIRCTRGRLPD